MKTCTKCKKSYPLTEFNWKKINVSRSSHCKTCSRKYIKNHYYKNKKYYLANVLYFVTKRQKQRLQQTQF